MSSFYDTAIEYLKGVGPQRASLIKKELSIHTFRDLIQHYPFRYEDRTRIYLVEQITDDMPFVQLKGFILRKELIGIGRKKRLTAQFKDQSGTIELVWFQGIKWVDEKIKSGIEYIVFGKPNRFGNRYNIAHPEIEPLTEANQSGSTLTPIYSLTDNLRSRRIDSKVISKLIKELLRQSKGNIRETLPIPILNRFRLLPKEEAIQNIHFPIDIRLLNEARRRLKFEELFYVQLRLIKLKIIREDKFKGYVFNDTSLVTTFYKDYLPFTLTEAQKRVIKEIYTDLRSGIQMNRLLQGDVGSGKTMVAFICMLITVGSGAQCALMAPTEILAQQHFNQLKHYADKLSISINLLTGSVKRSARKEIHEKLRTGELNILVGTHALLEDEVKFRQLGLAVVDEQHRFGVAQRSKLWKKNSTIFPHVLVMTATPIPRTLAMTLYGDLDVSVIDELPAGRKPIKTIHKYDSHRLEVNGFLKSEISKGRQIYIVYPLIDESEKLDLKHLMDGYESICRAFPECAISIVHGKMKADAKEYEMKRFLNGETQIMVATTVIEVGVDVPNATVMVIENAERFGLSQLHQLRGRVGRGAEKSYCLLMTNYKLSTDSKSRVNTMVETNNGFDIAETDLKLRGPGDLMGTQQSGVLDLLIADLAKDGEMLKIAREIAIEILQNDPDLVKPENAPINHQLKSQKKSVINWSQIS